MNNKLVLDRGAQQYIWDKHEIDLIHNYFWNKYNVDIDYLYKWKQSYAVYSPQFYWDVYQLLNTVHFTWDTYELKEIATYYWNTYEVNTETTYFWDRYELGTTYYWRVYADNSFNVKWDKYTVQQINYNYKYKWALNDIRKYVMFSKTAYLSFKNVQTDIPGVDIIAYPHHKDKLPSGMAPSYSLTISDLDVSTVDSIGVSQIVGLIAYPESGTPTISDIPNTKWRYEIEPYTNNTFTVDNLAGIIDYIESYHLNFIKVNLNGILLKTVYYIYVQGISKAENSIIKNLFKVEFDFEPDVYYTPNFNNNSYGEYPKTFFGTYWKEDNEFTSFDCSSLIAENGGQITDITAGNEYTIYNEELNETTTTPQTEGLVTTPDGESINKSKYGLIRVLDSSKVIKGEYIETVSSTDINAYPLNGVRDGYLYEYKEATYTGGGSYISTVNSPNPDAYPPISIQPDGHVYVFDYSESSKGEYVDVVSSPSSSAYPSDGAKDNYWYTYKNSETTTSKGTLLGQVSSANNNAYPQDGIQDNVWYEYTGSGTTQEKGNPTGNSVESTDGTAYPESGAQNGVWYESTGNYTTQSKGSHIEQVSSTSRDTYPQDGIQGNYWYTYNHESENYTKGEETGTIVSSGDAAAYPNNGRLAADGFWYESIEPETSEKKGSLIGSITTNSPNTYPKDSIQDGYWYTYTGEDSHEVRGESTGTQVSSLNRNAYPDDGVKNGYWYVFNSEKFIYTTITDTELYGGVKYKSYINTEADWRAGTVSSASIEFTTSFPVALGDEIQYFKRYSRDNSWSYVDNYIVDEVIKTPYQDVYKVVAYDYITLFDVYVDEWLKTLTYPITIQNLYTQLVSHIQTTSGKDLSVLKTNIGTNGSIEVLHGFEGVNITGRQILQFIAEATGRCVGMRSTEANRYIDVQAWGEAGTFNSVPSNRVSLNMSEYEIAAPTKVVVRTTEDDVGGSAGSGTEGYDVVGNPLFYGVSQATLNTAAAGILSEMTPAHNFHNGTIEMLQDYDIPINSWFRIYAADGTTDLGYFLAMGKEFDGKGVKYTCEGKATRDTQASNQNSEIIALLGKYNELKSSIDENSATIVDLTQGQSSITQRVDSISTSVNDLQGNQSSITQTVDSLNSKVTAQGNKVNSLESEINQTAEEISLKVSKNEIISAINLSTESVDISSDKINLTGYITATDLRTGGATTINGSNITTGTISADRINLTGAISWGDLDSNVQSEIQAGGGGGLNEDEVNTLITDKLVSSPTIAGGKFADLNKKNYLKMGASSDNRVGYLNHYFTPYSTSEPVCVMGYQEGQLPNWVLAPYNVPVLAFARQSSTSGTTAAMGKWDFSGATVTGLNVSGGGNVVPVWG